MHSNDTSKSLHQSIDTIVWAGDVQRRIIRQQHATGAGEAQS